MYQSLYRKYRPRTFDDVVGQEIIVKTLKNAINNNKISHAYLFTGPRGTGKTSMAKIFAQTINCENVKNAIPCNKCDSCLDINSKKTVDVVEIDAASNNGVDEIRELRTKASLVPTVGKYKIYIIDEVHMLTTGAFNALLKTLEEPPAHVIFILATTEPHKIPQTILSRCQRFDFKKIPFSYMVERLNHIAKEENVEIEDGVCLEISKLSSGCMRDALSILDQALAYAEDKVTLEDIHEINGTLPIETMVSFIKSIINKDYDTCFHQIEKYNTDGKNFIKLAENILYFLRDVMLYMNVKNYDFDEDTSYYEEILKQNKNIDILSFIKIINEYISVMKKNENQEIVFEMMIISLMNSFDGEIKKIEKKESDVSRETSEKEEINVSRETLKEEKTEIKEKEEEKEEKQDDNLTRELKAKIEYIENIRVNNTLCNFDKKEFVARKKKLEELTKDILDLDYSEETSMLMDGEMKAYGDGNYIFLFPSTRMKDAFNSQLLEMDDILSKFFNEPVRSIAICKDEWEQIKKEFNNKEKTYSYIEEPKDLRKYFSNKNKTKTSVENLFGEIVEYN